MPQKGLSKKRERQYEHVKESEKKAGRSTGRAKEIAARTVNKQRAQAGETKGSAKSSGSSKSKSVGTSKAKSAGTSKRSGAAKASSRSTSSSGRASSSRSGSTSGRSASAKSRSTSSTSRSRSTSSSANGGKTKEQLYKEATRLGIDGRSKMSKQQLQRAVARKKK